jgi:hypothetical protein
VESEAEMEWMRKSNGNGSGEEKEMWEVSVVEGC